MLDRILDGIVVLSPLAIALMSVLVGMKLAKNPTEQTHKRWWWGIVALGLICTGVTLWQQERSRRAHSAEAEGQHQALEKLQAKFDEAENKHTVETKYM